MEVVSIEKLDHHGRGIARKDGKVIFVEKALPQECVQIQILKSKKNLEEAKVLSYKKYSKDRVESNCPYYSMCGSCHIRHLFYEKQLEWKMEKVKEIFQKFMNDDSILIQPIVGGIKKNYRNKATFQVKNQIGYFEKESNRIVPIDDCKLVDFKINKILSLLCSLNIKNCKQIIVRVSKYFDESMVIFVENGKMSVKEIILQLKPFVTSIYVKGKELECVFGNSYIQEKLGDFVFEISPDSFFQVNTEQAKKLYDIVTQYASFKKTDTVLDLYCGTGTIGIYVSSYVHKVLGVEINPQAIMDAKRNQFKNHVENIEFICGDVSKVVEKIKDKFDVVIIDPPRSGLDPKTISFLKNCGAFRIIYVSCDPVTLVRDLKELNLCYTIKEVIPVDMFPNTYHVECVCVLNKR